MIKYYINGGDPESTDLFVPYVWGQEGFDEVLSKILAGKKSSGLQLLLIKYIVDGRFQLYKLEDYKVSNYSSKNRDIAVDVPVKRSDFHDRSEQERKRFIIDSTEKAIMLVHERMVRKGLEFDLPSILSDIRIASSIYLK